MYRPESPATVILPAVDCDFKFKNWATHSPGGGSGRRAEGPAFSRARATLWSAGTTANSSRPDGQTFIAADGTLRKAEIHWFETHGIGRKDFKIKRVVR